MSASNTIMNFTISIFDNLPRSWQCHNETGIVWSKSTHLRFQWDVTAINRTWKQFDSIIILLFWWMYLNWVESCRMILKIFEQKILFTDCELKLEAIHQWISKRLRLCIFDKILEWCQHEKANQNEEIRMREMMTFRFQSTPFLDQDLKVVKFEVCLLLAPFFDFNNPIKRMSTHSQIILHGLWWICEMTLDPKHASKINHRNQNSLRFHASSIVIWETWHNHQSKSSLVFLFFKQQCFRRHQQISLHGNRFDIWIWMSFYDVSHLFIE
jgi:hypothetical protein